MSALDAPTDYERYDDEVLRLMVTDMNAVPIGPEWTYKAIIRNLIAEVQRLRAEMKEAGGGFWVDSHGITHRRGCSHVERAG